MNASIKIPFRHHAYFSIHSSAVPCSLWKEPATDDAPSLRNEMREKLKKNNKQENNICVCVCERERASGYDGGTNAGSKMM